MLFENFPFSQAIGQKLFQIDFRVTIDYFLCQIRSCLSLFQIRNLNDIEYNQYKQLTTLQSIKSVMRRNQFANNQDQQSLLRIVLTENSQILIEDINQNFNKSLQNINHDAQESIQAEQNEDIQDNVQLLGHGWTQDESDNLFQLFFKFGSKWTKISHQMKGRSQNCIKNRFYGSLRKVLRRMNKAAKFLVKKFKKELKFQSITRIIDASEGLFRLKSPLKEQSESLSKKILLLARKEEHDMLPNQAEEMIKEINKFNMLTRSYKSQKKISNSLRSNAKTKTNFSQTHSSNKTQREMPTLKQRQQIQPSISPAVSMQQMNCLSDHEEVKLQEQNMIKLKAIEQVQISPYMRSRNMYDEILEELEMEAHSPLECEAWL